MPVVLLGKTTVSSATASVSFEQIPNLYQYKHLWLLGTSKMAGTGEGRDYGAFRVNYDSTAVYDRSWMAAYDAASNTSTSVAGETESIAFSAGPNDSLSTPGTNNVGVVDIRIPAYMGGLQKAIMNFGGVTFTNSDNGTSFTGNYYDKTFGAPIYSVTYGGQGTNLKDKTTLALFGVY